MYVSDVMRADVVTVDPGTTLTEAARILRSNQVSAVIATDGTNPQGILTERDVVQAVVDGADPATTLVKDRMTTELVTIGPGSGADDAMDLMATHGIRHVPVVDDGRLVGIV